MNTSTISTNLCPRCGKPRVNQKTWTEEVKTASGISIVTFTKTICPDPKCQQQVEAKLTEMREKSRQIEDNQARKVEERKAHRAQLNLSKKNSKKK